MTIRPAELADEAILRELWAAFEAEIPAPAEWRGDVGGGMADVSADIAAGASCCSPRTTRAPVGAVRARMRRGERLAHRDRVRPAARHAAAAC